MWAGLLLLGLAASWTLGIAVQQGLGLGNDSVAYIGGAKSLLAGTGYSRIWLTDHTPITHFPPLLSILLALGALGGADILNVSFWLIVVLYGLNTCLAGLLAWRITGLVWVGWLAALLIAVNFNMLRVHSYVMSEPLFLFFSLLFFLLLARYYADRRLGWMFGLGILAGLAFLTRYVAVAFFPLAVLAVFLLERRWRERLTAWVVYAGGSLPLMLAWLARNSLVGGSATNRQVIWHPVSAAKIQFGLDNLWSLFVPERLVKMLTPYQAWTNLLLAGSGLALLAWLGWAGMRLWRKAHPAKNGEQNAAWLTGDFVIFSWIAYSYIYLVVMLVSMSVYDAATIFEHRILAPIYVCLLVGMAFLAGWLWEQGRVWLRLATLVTVLGFVGLSALNTARQVSVMRYDAQGFASRVWRESELIGVIRRLPEGKVIYTNKPTLVYIQTGRATNALPTPYDTALGLARQTYDTDLKELRQRADQERAAIAILGWEWMESPEGKAWYSQMIQGLTAVTSTSEGALFLAHP